MPGRNLFASNERPQNKVSDTPLRPFRADERRENNDGSFSTEVTTTWELPDGRWANVPSLWMGPQGPVQFDETDEQSILEAMRAYESANGETFSRYSSADQAVRAAQERSNRGGAAANERPQKGRNLFADQAEEARPTSYQERNPDLARLQQAALEGDETALRRINADNLERADMERRADASNGQIMDAIDTLDTPAVRRAGAFADGAANSITFGNAANINAALDTGLGMGGGNQTFSQAKDRQQRARAEIREENPVSAMAGDLIGFLAPGGAVAKGAGKLGSMLPKAAGPGGRYAQRLLGLSALGGAENAAYQATAGASNTEAMMGEDASLGDRVDVGMQGATDPLALAAGPALSLAGRGVRGLVTGRATPDSLPANQAQRQSLSTVLEATTEPGTVTPDGFRALERFVRDKSGPLDGVSRSGLDRALKEIGQPSTGTSALPTRFKDVLVEGLDGGNGQFRNAVESRLKAAALSSGTDGSNTVLSSIDQDLPASRQYLQGRLNEVLGSQSRLGAKDDIEAKLRQIGREGYEPILRAGPQSVEGAEALRKVMFSIDDEFMQEASSGEWGDELAKEAQKWMRERSAPGQPRKQPKLATGMTRVLRDLKDVADGLGVPLMDMIRNRPLEAAHWMQSTARQLADTPNKVQQIAFTGVRKRLLDAINEASPGYDAVRLQYGDEYGNLQALEFGDRFLTQARKGMEVDQMARDFGNLAPEQKKAALLSVRDTLLSAAGRGKAGAAPRLTQLTEEQTLDALRSVFGDAGEEVAGEIERVQQFVSSRQNIDPRNNSATASNQEALKEAEEGMAPAWRRRLGGVLQGAGNDLGVSSVAGVPMPISTARSAARSLGRSISGNITPELDALAKILEAPVRRNPEMARLPELMSRAAPPPVSVVAPAIYGPASGMIGGARYQQQRR